MILDLLPWNDDKSKITTAGSHVPERQITSSVGVILDLLRWSDHKSKITTEDPRY